ncbi:hypothetical protein [Sphingobacterium sp. BIGb0165]|uniref:hypothetical protein n=1 Tax=Sphingobacterium sp. BIGb0165 TaxID=2940615 RepID=UPI00216A283E|nr:hypothetical protein [Sphingobacterium sp. BIGb0165]MCS4229243.1 hypothetical protein [Sphingobacterium sp. BIGb0165]
MKQELEESINFCIEALNNKNKGNQEVNRNDKFVLETLNKTLELSYQGRNLGIGDYGFENYRNTFVIKQKYPARTPTPETLATIL